MMPSRSGFALVFLVATVCACVGFLSAPSVQAAAASASSKPNIVFIISDDEDVRSHAFMPKTKALVEDQGIVFENFFVTYALCCPSRTSILRGQYAHNTGVVGNEPPQGGFEVLRARGLEESTFATWLQAAGYHTAYFGKYLNGYHARQHAIPTGWTDWYGSGNGFPNFNYTLSENGELVEYGNRPEDYLTDVLARKASGVIRRAAADGEPFFLHISPFTPHTPATWAPRHDHMFTDVIYPRLPSFNEADVGDKPTILRTRPPLTASQIDQIDLLYRARLRSLQAIDDMVETLVTTLDETGQLENTYVVYTSDHGFKMGEHRARPGKDTAYEEDIRVPFAIRGPGVPVGKRLEPMVLNIDLAPTFADIAGVAPPDFIDGRSFLPLFEDPDRPWRQSFLTERRERIGREQQERLGPIRFEAIRTPRWTYVEYASGEREFYDHVNDPYQLENLAGKADSALVEALASRLAQLANCAGAECRRFENLPIGSEAILSAAPPAAAKLDASTFDRRAKSMAAPLD